MSEDYHKDNKDERDLMKEMMKLTIHLLCFKHKMKNIVWTKGTSGLDGKFQSGSEVSPLLNNAALQTRIFSKPTSHFIKPKASLNQARPKTSFPSTPDWFESYRLKFGA